MKTRALYLLLIFLLVSSYEGYGQVAEAAPRQCLVKCDLLGLATAIPFARKYLRFSPELEYQPKKWRSVSFTLDLEYFRSALPIHGYYDIQGNGYKEEVDGEVDVKEPAARLGIRKYFGAAHDRLSGVFVEAQTGISRLSIDTVFYVVSQPVARMRSGTHLEARFRVGYQAKLRQRFWYSISLEGDVRRFLTHDLWYRVIVPEFNLGFLF
jgi:hypothetical protein